MDALYGAFQFVNQKHDYLPGKFMPFEITSKKVT